MSELSIAIKGDGPLLQVWPTHAMKQFRGATIYDRSAKTTRMRQAEVNLGKQGALDPAGQASAKRTAENLSNPTETDVVLTFSGSAQKGMVKVKCKRGGERAFQVQLKGLSDAAIKQAFFHVDAAITSCKVGGAQA